MTMCSLLLLLFTLIGDSFQDDITPASTELLVSEGETASLSCNYNVSVSVNNLQWYRQNPGSKPEFIIMLYEYRDNELESAPLHPRASGKVNKGSKQVHLNISSAEVSDSAVYYCALEPTVTGTLTSLYKNSNNINCKSVGNYITPVTTVKHAIEGEHVELSCKYDGTDYSLHWYPQFSYSVPRFLILEYRGYITNATPPVPGLSIKHDKTAKQVSLEISSAEVSDSAVYYCALQPTVSGNPAALNKNPHS
ncbi:uncharacterized protein LOC121723859 [Alosa sapidissima]|uniref:uncharacterized protein LOC121723859 n=1 Tax=Alosa sapidissima TaxID=34773 RepID=UPI001C08DECF|nr:uncharacterized protein LOC121723859 [Alosa sapidissima]